MFPSADFFRWLDRLERVVGLVFRNRELSSVQAQQGLAAFYQHAWEDAAHQLGAVVEPLGCGVLEIRRGRAAVRVRDNCTGIDDQVSHAVVRTKPVMSQLLAAEGLPVPRFLHFNRHEIPRAVAFMRSLGPRPCVVKPAVGTGGGAGVTTEIRTSWSLSRAVAFAAHYAESFLIEEQVPGENYRLLYLDGVLLNAVHRKSPTVVGDGTRSIRTLVRDANLERERSGDSHALLTFNRDLMNTLRAQGLSPASVPAAGVEVRIKNASNENAGRQNVSVTSEVHPSVVEQGRTAARASKLRLAGVDVMTTDHRQPLSETGGVILEVNSPPGYFWHYHTSDGGFPVAVHVLQVLLDEAGPHD
jgi:D-alanine-D-alanine ligase-like ATP-grasp enzyme